MTDSFNQEECRTLRGSEAQEENLRSLPNKEGETDSGWNYKQPKFGKRCWEAGCDQIDARQTGEFIEERLSRLGLGNHGDEAAKKGGMRDFRVGEDESRIVSKSILDECVQMVVEERGVFKKDGCKEIFDADDDEAQDGRNGTLKREKLSLTPRLCRELLRSSSTPRLAAWLLQAGASEAQVLTINQLWVDLY